MPQFLEDRNIPLRQKSNILLPKCVVRFSILPKDDAAHLQTD